MVSSNSRWLTLLACTGLFASGCVIEFNKGDSPTGEGDATEAETTDQETGTTTGEGDDGPIKPEFNCELPSPCSYLGVCEGRPKPICNDDGTWDCTGEGTWTPPAEFEAAETRCDGLDNDCDGKTDEDLVDDTLEGCLTNGVCGDEGKATRACTGGAWECQYTSGAYEATETACDGLDNDCDGATDDGLTALAGKVCQWDGVCAGFTGNITCSAGAWNCSIGSYDGQIPAYQSGEETLCDGRDNDCDGKTDEDIAGPGFLAESSCLTAGECATTAAATCTMGSWTCQYDGEASPPAEACDGKDNDCDGFTDEQVALTVADCGVAAVETAGNGVCTGLGFAFCDGGSVKCSFETVPGYQKVETACDGLDNDCDGAPDNDLGTPPASECALVGEGVCGPALTGSCQDGAWECAYGSTDFEPEEVTCDGKDNDCDGQTDEGTAGDISQCETDNGVCKDAVVTVKCIGGASTCVYGAVPGYEAEETTCDNKDNDCDGVTDEDIFDLASSTCKKLGICATPNKVMAECENGTWSCEYELLGDDYQGELETSCDNKDNDCDGVIDEGIIVDDPPAELCPSQGVCAGSVKALCVGGTSHCLTTAVEGYEFPEASCDNKDNDCDGTVDEGVCGTGQPCAGAQNCKDDGLCREGPDGETTYCVADETVCPGTNGDAVFALGTSTCRDLGETQQKLTCQQVGWVPENCETACVEGECTDCLAGSVNCSAEGDKIQACDSEGNLLPEQSCPTFPVTTNCISGFTGICLLHADTPIDPADDDEEARGCVVSRVGAAGELAVMMETNASSPKTFGVGREVDSSGVPTDPPGTSPYLVLVSPSSDRRGFQMVNVNLLAKRVALTWEEEAASGDINVRVALASFKTLTVEDGPKPANKTTDLEQSHPAIAKYALSNNRVMVSFQSQATAGGNGFDIFVRAYNISGTSLSAVTMQEERVNDYVDGDQTEPRLTALSDGNFAVAWNDSARDATTDPGVYGRIVGPSGATVSAADIQLHTVVDGDQTHVDLASDVGSSGFVAVWTHSPNAGEGDIHLRTFNNAGVANETAPTLVTQAPNGSPAVGDQRRPSVAFTPDGGLAIVYEDSEVDGNSYGIALIQVSKTLELGTARVVNEGIQDQQLAPRLAVSGGLNTPWALVCFESINTHGTGHPGVFTRPIPLKP